MEHYNFKPGRNILFVVDYKCISIVNKDTGDHLTLNYPDAAIWAILIEKHNKLQTTQMLMSVLEKTPIDTISHIEECLKQWKEKDLIE